MVIDGIYYALGLIAGGALAGYLTRPALGIPFYVLAAFCLWFFRDPDRQIPEGPVAVSPADGKVVSIVKSGEITRVSIFLNVFDVHVNRSPIAGKITAVDYHRGKFLVASKEEASTENERNEITVEGDGVKVKFSQITGLIARRIVCYVKPGETVAKGQRIGYIKFGSRVDMWMGPEWQIDVKAGERVSAGSTVIAKRKG
jgi:phosphatidylserine decarboxylase